MFPSLRKPCISLVAALATASFLADFVIADVAHAQDDDRRRLRARQMDETDTTSEYAKLAEEKRLQSIAFLKDLLANGDAEGEQKAEMMLRLADLYFEQGRTIYLREMAAYDKEFEKCFNTEGCDTETLEADNKESAGWQERSIRLYEQILRSYPRYPRADEATFYLGMALNDLKRTSEAVRYFDRLTKQYPNSSYAPDAFVNLGEYYFEEKKDAFSALKKFKKVVDKYPDSAKYSFALYKLAWCYYNVGEYGKAIDSMKLVVSNTQAGAQDKSKMQLQDEALKDLVRFFADAGAMDEAYEYFTKLGKNDLIRSMLKRLAGMYFEQGKFEQCIQTYKRLIGEDPNSKNNPNYQADIIKAYKKIGKKTETVAEIDRLLKTYGKNSAWARANASNQDAVKKASKTIEKNLRDVAVEYHLHAAKLGRSSAAKETYKLAYDAYKVYLSEYPESQHAYEMRYNFGEMLWDIKRYDEAYEQYMAVVKTDPKGKRSKHCAESAIHAAENMVKKEGGGTTSTAKKPIPKGPKEPQELTQWEQNLVTACRQFADIFPEDKKVRNVIYRSAYLLYHKYRFDEAADQFKAVIKMDPRSREAEQAANLILDAFVVTGDTAGLKKNAKFYFEQEGLGSSRFKKEVYTIYQNASFKLIEETLEKDENKGKAAEAFEAFYGEFPQSKQASLALNNASVYYFGEARLADAMRVRHILVDDPKFGPKTKYYYDTIAALGDNYETIANFDTAANFYEKMFSLYPERRKKLEKEKASDETIAALDDNAKVAIRRSAYFRKAADDASGAIANYKKFITTFSDDPEVPNFKLTIAKIYEEQKDWSKAANEFYNFYRKAGKETNLEFVYFAYLHHGLALEELKQQSKAMGIYKMAVDKYRKYVKSGGEAGAHTEFAAKMMFKLAAPELEDYLELKIEGLGAGAGRRAEDRATIASLNKKKKSLQETVKLYEEVVLTGDGEMGLASLVVLGRLFENMGESLLNSHVPYYLTDDQREIYTMGMQDQAYPLTEKAIEWYRGALDKAYELTLYNDDTAFANRRLGELRPNDFPGLEEEVLVPRYTSAKERTYDFETSLK